LRNYWASTCPTCPIKRQCTTGKERRGKRWGHKAIIDAMQRRLDQAPDIMRIRRQTVGRAVNRFRRSVEEPYCKLDVSATLQADMEPSL
jgi:hypothetical protein